MKHVKQIGDLLYFRRKVAGKDTYVRLPAYGSPEFQAAYDRLVASSKGRDTPAPGTLAALVRDYRGSVEFRGKAGKTQMNQRRYLDMIETEHGARLVRQIRPSHVYKMRDELADTPGKANNWLSVFKSLMKHACRTDVRADNPASEVPILAIGEHEPWPADLLSVCIEVATPMTRLAIITGLCSGQRIGDCVRMQYGWITAGIMEFEQQKVRRDGSTKHVAVPMHPLLQEELARLPRRAVTLLYDRTGRPFGTPDALQGRLRALMAQPPVQEVLADLIAREVVEEGETFTFHGLRKNACCYLVEMGLADTEVGGILGMSPEMVRHYSKRARALMIARGAADRIAGGKIMVMPGR